MSTPKFMANFMSSKTKYARKKLLEMDNDCRQELEKFIDGKESSNALNTFHKRPDGNAAMTYLIEKFKPTKKLADCICQNKNDDRKKFVDIIQTQSKSAGTSYKSNYKKFCNYVISILERDKLDAIDTNEIYKKAKAFFMAKKNADAGEIIDESENVKNNKKIEKRNNYTNVMEKAKDGRPSDRIKIFTVAVAAALNGAMGREEADSASRTLETIAEINSEVKSALKSGSKPRSLSVGSAPTSKPRSKTRSLSVGSATAPKPAPAPTHKPAPKPQNPTPPPPAAPAAPAPAPKKPTTPAPKPASEQPKATLSEIKRIADLQLELKGYKVDAANKTDAEHQLYLCSDSKLFDAQTSTKKYKKNKAKKSEDIVGIVAYNIAQEVVKYKIPNVYIMDGVYNYNKVKSEPNVRNVIVKGNVKVCWLAVSGKLAKVFVWMSFNKLLSSENTDEMTILTTALADFNNRWSGGKL